MSEPRGEVRMGPRGMQLTMPADAEPEEARARWSMHILAAVSEGFCPNCGSRMEAAETPSGPGGLCHKHGLWQTALVGTPLAEWNWWVADGGGQ